MKVKQLKEYIDSLPEDCLEFDVRVESITPIMDKYDQVKQNVNHALELIAFGANLDDGDFILLAKYN